MSSSQNLSPYQRQANQVAHYLEALPLLPPRQGEYDFPGPFMRLRGVVDRYGDDAVVPQRFFAKYVLSLHAAGCIEMGPIQVVIFTAVWTGEMVMGDDVLELLYLPIHDPSTDDQNVPSTLANSVFDTFPGVLGAMARAWNKIMHSVNGNIRALTVVVIPVLVFVVVLFSADFFDDLNRQRDERADCLRRAHFYSKCPTVSIAASLSKASTMMLDHSETGWKENFGPMARLFLGLYHVAFHATSDVTANVLQPFEDYLDDYARNFTARTNAIVSPIVNNTEIIATDVYTNGKAYITRTAPKVWHFTKHEAADVIFPAFGEVPPYLYHASKNWTSILRSQDYHRYVRYVHPTLHRSESFDKFCGSVKDTFTSINLTDVGSDICEFARDSYEKISNVTKNTTPKIAESIKTGFNYTYQILDFNKVFSPVKRVLETPFVFIGDMVPERLVFWDNHGDVTMHVINSTTLLPRDVVRPISDLMKICPNGTCDSFFNKIKFISTVVPDFEPTGLLHDLEIDALVHNFTRTATLQYSKIRKEWANSVHFGSTVVRVTFCIFFYSSFFGSLAAGFLFLVHLVLVFFREPLSGRWLFYSDNSVDYVPLESTVTTPIQKLFSLVSPTLMRAVVPQGRFAVFQPDKDNLDYVLSRHDYTNLATSFTPSIASPTINFCHRNQGTVDMFLPLTTIPNKKGNLVVNWNALVWLYTFFRPYEDQLEKFEPRVLSDMYTAREDDSVVARIIFENNPNSSILARAPADQPPKLKDRRQSNTRFGDPLTADLSPQNVVNFVLRPTTFLEFVTFSIKNRRHLFAIQHISATHYVANVDLVGATVAQRRISAYDRATRIKVLTEFNHRTDINASGRDLAIMASNNDRLLSDWLDITSPVVDFPSC